jgi:diguanylate cyclase
MGLFGKDKAAAAPETVDNGSDAGASSAAVLPEKDLPAFLIQAVHQLMDLIKAFTMDLDEIGADRFKEGVDQTRRLFDSDLDIAAAGPALERQHALTLDFIRRARVYFEDREQEFKDIIDLLTKAMSTLNSDNAEFNQRIHAQSEKIEQITLLDDIKEIKSRLQEQVAMIRDTVAQKQKRDNTQADSLSEQVNTLKNELEAARSASLKDGLTGVYNRAAFDDYLSQIIGKAGRRRRSPFSLLMLDIDNFKAVNDTWGHPIGDRVLLATVRKCAQFTREDDFVARYGGEEFAVILPGASLKNAVKTATRICESISETQYTLSDDTEDGVLTTSVSIGVSTFRADDTPASLVARADKALYQAKASGKNRVVGENELADSP